MSPKTVEAEYDGRVFIPVEPLDLPPGKRVKLTVEPEDDEPAAVSRFSELWKDLASRPARGASPDAESLRREHLHGEEQ